MPHTAQELRRLIALRGTTAVPIQEVLLRDPAAALALLRRLGQLRPAAANQVIDLAHALTLVGLETLPQLVEQLPALPRTGAGAGAGAGAGNRDPRGGYSAAVHAAAYASQLARRLGPAKDSSLATAALLQSPAVIALWTADPDAAERATRATRRGTPCDLAWSEQLGAPVGQVNRDLAEAWSFPDLARQALAGAESRSRSEQAVWLAAELARSTAAGWHHPDTGRATRLLADFLDGEPEQAAAWLRRQSVEAARLLAPCGYPAPGFELLYVPGGEPVEEEKPSTGVNGAAQPPQAGATESAADLQTLVTGFMHRIREETGTEQVVFAMLSRDRRRLRARLAVGSGPDQGLRGLDLDLGQRHLFSLLMGKPQSLWLRPENAMRYLELLPPNQRDWLDARGSYLMSLYAEDRPLGLLYAGGGSTGDAGYRSFRMLCQAMADALAGIPAAHPASV